MRQRRQKTKFALDKSPMSYVISVHLTNMIQTYGEKAVKKAIKDLFLSEKVNKQEEAV